VFSSPTLTKTEPTSPSDTQPLTVLIDPRVTTPPAELEQEFQLASDLTSMMSQVATARSQADNLRKQVQEVRPKGR
jgi:hypothetical protein